MAYYCRLTRSYRHRIRRVAVYAGWQESPRYSVHSSQALPSGRWQTPYSLPSRSFLISRVPPAFWTQFTEAGFAGPAGLDAGQDMAVILSSEMHLSLPAGCHPMGQVAHDSGTSARVGHPIETSGQPWAPLSHIFGTQDSPSAEERMFPGQLGHAVFAGAFFGWLVAAKKKNKTANSRITYSRCFTIVRLCGQN